jgi:hypothetical protein
MAISVNGAVLGAVPVHAVPIRSVDDPAPPVIPPDAPSLQRSAFLSERLRAALFDLCVRVPSAWIRPTPKGVAFGTLTIRQTRRLVSSLEDAARALESSNTPSDSVLPDPQRVSQSGGDL